LPDSSESDWTRDADGNFVDWTKAPHYVNGKLDLLLPGEDRNKMPRDVFSKRTDEYTKLAKRKLKT
jgi:hypothetical protein